jgi:hypothetical protein
VVSQFSEVLFDLFGVIGVTGVLIEVLDAINSIDRALLESARGERVNVHRFGQTA